MRHGRVGAACSRDGPHGQGLGLRPGRQVPRMPALEKAGAGFPQRRCPAVGREDGNVISSQASRKNKWA